MKYLPFSLLLFVGCSQYQKAEVTLFTVQYELLANDKDKQTIRKANETSVNNTFSNRSK